MMARALRAMRPSGWEKLLVGVSGVLFVLVWSLSNGRDLNWDFLNYHLYAGFTSLNDRLSQDYFPANVQSYLLGYAYVPLYLAIRAGWETWLVQSMLGLLSVPTILAAWYMARRVLTGDTAEVAAWRIAMVLAAVSSPLFLMEIGTSFVDGWTSAFVLASLLLAIPGTGSASWRVALVSGALAGAACALKMTNTAMVAGIGFVWLLCSQGGWRKSLALATAFGVGAAACFLLVYGYWGWKLYMRFGNPFFPMLANETFRAPEYLPVSVVLDRFRPLGFWEFVLRPLYMMDPVANVYTEARAPDTRYVAALLLAAGFAVQRLLRHLDRDRPLEALLLWCGITWVLWLVTSGNGRYSVALALGSGIAALALAERLWHARSAHIFAIKAMCLALLGLQVLSMSLTVFRWDGRHDESQRYFAPEPDVALKEQPHVIVNLDFQSISWLAPFVHPDSVLVSPAGQYTFSPSSPAGAKLTQILQSGMPVVLSYKATTTSRAPLESQRLPERLSPYQRLYGVDVLPGNCRKVLMDRTEGLVYGRMRVEHDSEVQNLLVVCPMKYNGALSKRTQAEFSEHDALFDKVEKACPALFRPAGGQTMCNDNFCGRIYLNSDNNLHVFRDGGLVATGFNGIQPAFIGTATGILAGEKPVCPSRLGRYQPFTAGGSAFARPK